MSAKLSLAKEADSLSWSYKKNLAEQKAEPRIGLNG
jgi:hypothetical protein